MASVLRLRRPRRFCGAHVAGSFSRADNDPLNKTDPLGLRPEDEAFVLGVEEFQCPVTLPNGGEIGLPVPNAVGEQLEHPCDLYRYLSGTDPFWGVRLPAMVRQPSREIREYIVRNEGFVDELYNDPLGNCTGGVGHLIRPGPCSSSELGQSVSESQALDWLRSDLNVTTDPSRKSAADIIRDNITAWLTQYEFDALVSWAFNVGVGSVNRSELRIKLNDGDYGAVPGELAEWNTGYDASCGCQRELEGLTRRRAEEGTIFTTGTYP